MQLISFFFPSFSPFMLSHLVLRSVLGAGEESVVSPGSVSLSLSFVLSFFYLVFFKGFVFFFVFRLRFNRVLVKGSLPHCRV